MITKGVAGFSHREVMERNIRDNFQTSFAEDKETIIVSYRTKYGFQMGGLVQKKFIKTEFETFLKGLSNPLEKEVLQELWKKIDWDVVYNNLREQVPLD